MARSSRIKLRGCAAFYHCYNRIVGGECKLDETAREVFRGQLRRSAVFFGIKILSHCLMGSHFHLLLEIPHRPMETIPDEELIRRHEVLYGSSDHRSREVRDILGAGGAEAEALRQNLGRRMGDLSCFMKDLKQRFSIWYNHLHQRPGTLWAERFQSVLYENRVELLGACAAYLAMNPVRAGLCRDPLEYRHSTYAEAVAGDREALAGLRQCLGVGGSDGEVLRRFRLLLYIKGGRRKEGAAHLSGEAVRKVLEAGGRLSWPILVRHRIRYFTASAVLGSRLFFQEVRDKGVSLPGRGMRYRNPVRVTELGIADLHSLRRLNGLKIGR